MSFSKKKLMLAASAAVVAFSGTAVATGVSDAGTELKFKRSDLEPFVTAYNMGDSLDVEGYDLTASSMRPAKDGSLDLWQTFTKQDGSGEGIDVNSFCGNGYCTVVEIVSFLP